VALAPVERSNPDESIIPSKEQTDLTRLLLERTGLAGRDHTTRDRRLAYITDIIGRPITRTDELTRDEVTAINLALTELAETGETHPQ
jgi:hypothetical protein